MSKSKDAEPSDLTLPHQMHFNAMVLQALKNIVATIPAAGSAGHLVQQAEMSLNALRDAISPPPPPPEPDKEPAKT